MGDKIPLDCPLKDNTEVERNHEHYKIGYVEGCKDGYDKGYSEGYYIGLNTRNQ